MPFLTFEVYEFALVSLDGEPSDLATTGRIRITEKKDAPIKLEVKPCGEDSWRDPTPEDLDLFKKVVARYG